MSKDIQLKELDLNITNELKKIDNKVQLTEAYHTVMAAANRFSFLSPNIPKQLLEVVQHIHGRFDSCCYHIMKASNTFNLDIKYNELAAARSDLFFQYNSIEYLFKTKALTVGAANTVIEEISKGYEQLTK